MRIFSPAFCVQARSFTAKSFALGALLVGCGLPALSTNANVIYDESLSTDLSNSGLNPTVLTVSAGQNQVFGTTGRPAAGGTDRDYFTFTIPAGLELTSIVVLPGTTTGGDVSFIGMQSGNQVTLPGNAVAATGLLGWKHYSADNGNILPDMSIPAEGSTGFTIPLGAGSYAFWVQDFALGSFNYGFEFNLDPAPRSVPDSGPGMLASGLLFALLTGWARLRGRS